jgi:o-succinylbenzoate---CoA ligase
MKFEFTLGAKNQLLINPRLSVKEVEVLNSLKVEFEKEFGENNYFLVPSSGSSKKANESTKLIALHLNAVLNSAKRFNEYFKAGQNDDWGLLLPKFHVAGLGTCARAFLTGSKVIEDTSKLEEVSFLSLVPTQVFDVVSKNEHAPSKLKKVFVGAGALNSEIKSEALRLGWPIVETYGMTETASMIAVKEKDQLFALPNVQVDTANGCLKVKCDSLLTCSVQKVDDSIEFIRSIEGDWFQTEDRAEVKHNLINLLGRSSEYIKILGEGVSLAELSSQLVSIALRLKIAAQCFALLALPDARADHKIILAVEKSVDSEIIAKCVQGFNQLVRPYEKISGLSTIDRIPRTELGKVKTVELLQIVSKSTLQKV